MYSLEQLDKLVEIFRQLRRSELSKEEINKAVVSALSACESYQAEDVPAYLKCLAKELSEAISKWATVDT